ncbi:hypothetical protein QYE76_012526 [Lolium multiflorum]|uniref:Transposase (putative) gypsy type domain-containing protein n=1 Tax=Lolium multiflorum TaxID=4521 RepID=A0AAD8U145_LOLMU|nr:hypothetical protein QYE76_012526 [Lolium multiflorum]
MAEEQITYEDLPADHKKKYDELKAIVEAELIGSFEKTRSHGIRFKVFTPQGVLEGVDLSLPSQERTRALRQEINYVVAHSLHRHSESLVNSLERVALHVVQEIMERRYSPSGPVLGTHQGEVQLHTRPPLPYSMAAPQQQGSPAYVVYKVGGSAFLIHRTGSGFLMGLHGSGFLRRSVRIRLSDPGPDFILHDQQQLGRPMGHTPPSPSMGHPGLPDLGTVDGTPMNRSWQRPSPAPPLFAPVHPDPTKDSGKDTEGTSANPEKASGEEQAEQKAEEVAKKSKARKRDSSPKGNGGPAPPRHGAEELRSGRFPASRKLADSSGFLAPAPQDGEMVITKALVERGFSFPPSDFFSEILKAYGLQPHNISPNSVLAISNHVTLCEGHLRVTPELPLFQYYFTVKKEKIRQTSELATCGSITFMLRPGRVYPHTDRHESARYWSGSFFYLKDVSDPASDRNYLSSRTAPPVRLRHGRNALTSPSRRS